MRPIHRAACAAWLALAPVAAGDSLGGEPDHLTNGCAPLAVALRLAMAQYGEAAAFIGVTGNGVVVTVTSNARTGTWTLWGQRGVETVCLLTGGEGWQPAPDAVKQMAPPGQPS
jgi:hypothetical protein